MSRKQTPEEAISSEFGRYYGDDLPAVNTAAFRASIPQRAEYSAYRMRHLIEDDKLPELIALLDSVKHEPHGRVMNLISVGGPHHWPDDAQDLAVLNEIIEQILTHLRADPRSLPPRNQ
mgnify:CR=1 FL=1